MYITISVFELIQKTKIPFCNTHELYLSML